MSNNLDLDIQSNVLSSTLTDPSALSEFSSSNECENSDMSTLLSIPLHLTTLISNRSAFLDLLYLQG
jgi:hypothetical protein